MIGHVESRTRVEHWPRCDSRTGGRGESLACLQAQKSDAAGWIFWSQNLIRAHLLEKHAALFEKFKHMWICVRI